MSADPLALLRAVADVLDSLGIGAYVLDDQERTLLWNRSFLRLFPEHGGKIFSGESYERNLRRFFEARVGADDPVLLERLVRDALDRNRHQQRPIVFEHRGRRLRAGSLPLPGVGRMRVWIEQAPTADEAGASTPGPRHFDQLPDGVVVRTPDGLIGWANETFVSMFGLPDRRAALGQTLDQVYADAWSDAPDRTRFETGRMALAAGLRRPGLPFELPMPLDRWLRVIVRTDADSRGFFTLVDITELKHQQRALADKTAQLEALIARRGGAA
ncbi:MAG: hypothetical protein Fur0014_00520 [Rubrivivax sp.]